jgi:phosphodiesterase/alkaline phosphatase D-like protein
VATAPGRLVLVLAALLAAAVAAPRPLGADTVLVAASAVWKYLDNGSNQGTAWRSPGFDDSGWASGAAQLGYGDGDEATTVSYGPNASNKYVTTYFRHAFSVADPGRFLGLTLRLLRDDGAVVYLNGTEVFRSNMPAGALTSTTWASTALGAPHESAYVSTTVSPATLVAGTNVLAVEVHQANATSSDLSFALELIGTESIAVTRGPYLQTGTPSSVVVRWRTGAATPGRACYGPAPASLTACVDGSVGTEHEIDLTGLTPDTRYYYSVGTPTTALAGGDSAHVFVTAPSPGTAKPTRIWVIGDSGTANANAAAVRDAYLAYTGARGTDVRLMLGDNAYQSGLDSEYQAAVFDMYPSLLRTTVLWPSLGNHDGQSADSGTHSGPYYDIFTLPAVGEAGGVASGTEAYYSFDHSNIHFVVLDSFDSDRSPTGAMLDWLRADLAATDRQWIIAFWHHPPYSKGSHNSDTETELIQMRENVLPILEAAGVDLVLTGHSHSYERSYLLDGHYGASTTFTASMKKDGGSGREDGTGAYRKLSPGPAPHEGAVYAVAGSSGQTSGGTLNHPAMFVSLNVLGSMVLDVDGNRLDAVFLDSTGARRDYFTLVKGTTLAAPAAPTSLSAAAASSQRIDLTWTDNAGNEDGFQVERSTNGSTFALHGTVGANGTSYADTTVGPQQTYWYRVRATNAAGPSAYSNPASATTPAVPPAPPTGLTATAVSTSRIDLTWTDSSTSETGFAIERSTDGVSFTQIAAVGASVTTYASTGLSKNRAYYYRVRAFSGALYSSYSNTVKARTLRR